MVESSFDKYDNLLSKNSHIYEKREQKNCMIRLTKYTYLN